MEYTDVFICEEKDKDPSNSIWNYLNKPVIKPNFFIVGAPKCGTTAMNDYLHQHPDIFMARKEVHYFGKDLKTKMKLSESDYLKNFQDAGNKKIIGEASVWYLFSETAAEEIKKFAPHAKILIMLRNPAEVIHSLHSQHLFDGNEDVFDFETALNLDDERKKGINLPHSVDFSELPPYKDAVLFSGQVKRYFNVFAKENVHVILYDDFIANTKKTVSDTLKFLGVNEQEKIDYVIINPNKRIKWFYLHRMIKNPSVRLKRMMRLVLPVRKLRHFIMFYLFKWNIKTERREEMGVNLQTRLRKFLAGDINLLSKIINRDLSNWL